MNKKVLSFVEIIVCVLVFLGCTGNLYTNSDEYQMYIDSVPESDLFMPALEDLFLYQSFEVFYFENYDDSKSLNLIVTYSVEEYWNAKELIFDRYDFLSGPLVEYDYYTIPQCEFEYKGFVIKVVSDDNFDYPEYFGMLGCSDSKYQIAFLFFSDSHLHQLSNSPDRMTHLMESDFRFPEE